MVSYPAVFTLAACAVLSIPVLRKRVKRLRLVKMGSFWQSVLWSLRINKHNVKYSFPNTLEEWSIRYMPSPEEYLAIWELMRPFFASRGYTLYGKKAASWELLPAGRVAPSSIRCHPYTRIIDGDEDLAMQMDVNYVFGARDSLGRDVVIKVISESDKPSNEWKILRQFNQEDFRRDSANRIIRVIEFIPFDRYIFAVMPRWDPAFTAPFCNVAELMDVSRACLETMDYLHRHRIAHLDFSLGNLGMNLYATPALLRVATGIRDRQDVKYALYDFGHSLIYPAETDISKVKYSLRLQYTHAPDPTGEYNPFKSDVTMMGGLLHGHVMHAAKAVPEIEVLLDHMTELDEDARPTAAEALEAFTKIYEALTPEQLATPVDCKWTNAFWPKRLPEPED